MEMYASINQALEFQLVKLIRIYNNKTYKISLSKLHLSNYQAANT